MDKRLHIVRWGRGAQRKRTSIANWRGPVKWNAERARAIAAGENPAPHYVFCSSLADVFDNEVDPQWRADLFTLILATPHLTWQLLTKRIGNAAGMIGEALAFISLDEPDGTIQWKDSPLWQWPWPNVWIGATVVNQEEADRDIPKLLAVPAAKRFLSVEPMLGPITLATLPISVVRGNPFTGKTSGPTQHGTYEPLGGGCVDWVIVGFESGNDARPGQAGWIRKLRDECRAADTAFFFKQWGEWLPVEWTTDEQSGAPYLDADAGTKPGTTFKTGHPHKVLQLDGQLFIKVGAKESGNHLDGRQHLEFPQ